MSVSIPFRQLAVAGLTALALIGTACDQAAAQQPTPLLEDENPPVAESAVVNDIERTIRGLSGVTVSSRRIAVRPPSNQSAAVPENFHLAVGKARSVVLPGDAREVIVGDSRVADVTVSNRRRLFVMGRQAGTSNVYVLDGNGVIIARMEVSVGADVEAARAAISRILPDDAIEVSAEGGTLVLSGTVSSDGAAGRAALIARRFVGSDQALVNLININREQQVLIQVRVAEVQRNLLKEIGVTSVFNEGILGHASAGGAVFPRGLIKGNDFAGSFILSGIEGLLLQLRLLEERGLVRNLAEPNLVAVSGETASMLAGGEYPIPVPDKDGIKIEFKPFGVTLSFLPVVLDDGRISMKLNTEVSTLSTTNTVEWRLVNGDSLNINSFTVRRASSTVELPNGGSLMIAGLIQNDVLSGLAGVPGVMDIPVFGQLFRSDSFRRNETELVIIVNASLVRPTAPNTLVDPTQTLSPGGDLDKWLFGRMLGYYAPGFVQDASGRAHRPPPFGFTLDELLP